MARARARKPGYICSVAPCLRCPTAAPIELSPTARRRRRRRKMDHGERRNGHEAALRAVQKAPAKPWRGAPLAPAQPKVYRVEPRDFRELVQRLTGAGTASTTGPTAMGVPQTAPAHADAVHGRREAAAAEQFDYPSWFSAPLLSPASMPAGLNGHHGALL